MALVCDTCGAPATIVHLLPWCVRTEVVALSGECDCRTDDLEDPEEQDADDPRYLPDGYWFPISDWSAEFTDNPSQRWSMRDQLRGKINGGEPAIRLVDAKLGVE